MKMLFELNREELAEVGEVLQPADHATVRARLCELVGVAETAHEQELAPLLYAKSEVIARNVTIESGFPVAETLLEAGFSSCERLYFFEALFWGIDYLFIGPRVVWFENLLDLIGGAQDMVSISEDLDSIAILDHHQNLRFGKLSEAGFRDPFWVEYAAGADRRLAFQKRVMAAMEAKRRGGTASG